MARHKGPIRPAPADFIAVARTMHSDELVKHYGASRTLLARWVKESGAVTKGRIAQSAPPPDDFAEQTRTKHMDLLRKHYAVGERTIRRWVQATGVKLVNGNSRNMAGNTRPVPEDFAELAPTMTINALVKHYRTSPDAVSRWLRETGVKRDGYVPAPRAVSPSRYRSEFVFKGHAAGLVMRDMRPRSMYDEAADVLRRERFVVHRCDERGRYDPNGAHWRSGNSLLTPDELLARADRYRAAVKETGYAG